jgi:hypothetical protein
MVELENTHTGKLAYNLHSDLLCIIQEDLDRTVTEVNINSEENLTVYDLHQKCSKGEGVYAVTYVDQFESDEVLYMSRIERYDFVSVSDCDTMYVPESQLSIRDS